MTNSFAILTPTEFREMLDRHLESTYGGLSPFLVSVIHGVGENPDDFPADHSLGWTAYAKFERTPPEPMGPIIPEDYVPNRRGYELDETGKRKRTLHEWTPEQAKLIHAVWNLIPASAKL